MASSISSPATRTDCAVTMPAREMTATSVVPPPMSTTIEACGSVMGSPIPMPAAMGSSMRKTLRAPARSALLITARFSTGVMP